MSTKRRSLLTLILVTVAQCLLVLACNENSPTPLNAVPHGLVVSQTTADLDNFSVSVVPLDQEEWHELPPEIRLIDGGTPIHWTGSGGFVLFTSYGTIHGAVISRNTGTGLYDLTKTDQTTTWMPLEFVPRDRYLESTWSDGDGTLYGWYHEEREVGNPPLCEKMIGAAYSTNDGQAWTRFGLILRSDEEDLRFDDPSGTGLAGGHGDFCAMVDGDYAYVFYTNLSGPTSEQGIGVARIALEDLDDPVGNVWKWYDGSWSEPGLGGRTTPIIPVVTDWFDPEYEGFWGPSMHYNTHVDEFVMLMNHTGPEHAPNYYFEEEGIYIASVVGLDDPGDWPSTPVLLFDPSGPPRPGWYPNVIGDGIGETDKIAGQNPRLYLQANSRFRLEFALQ